MVNITTNNKGQNTGKTYVHVTTNMTEQKDKLVDAHVTATTEIVYKQLYATDNARVKLITAKVTNHHKLTTQSCHVIN